MFSISTEMCAGAKLAKILHFNFLSIFKLSYIYEEKQTKNTNDILRNNFTFSEVILISSINFTLFLFKIMFSFIAKQLWHYWFPNYLIIDRESTYCLQLVTVATFEAFILIIFFLLLKYKSCLLTELRRKNCIEIS